MPRVHPSSGLPDASSHPLPCELVTDCPEGACKARTAPRRPVAAPGGGGATVGRSWNMTTVQRGLRNVALFGTLLGWAYRQGRGGDFAAWTRCVSVEAYR